MALAQKLEQDKMLAASFFFDKRSTQDTGSILDMFVTTLARQISRIDPRYHRALGQALETNPDIVKDTLKLQIQALIIQPLRALYSAPTTPSSSPLMVLVFDALDECGAPNDLEIVLELLATLDSLPQNFHIFFSSRPQLAIFGRFSFLQTVLIEDLDDKSYEASANEDIFQFVQARFSNLVLVDRDPSWPPRDAEVRHFAGLSQGLFELAALRVRRIESAPSKGLRPKTVLERLKSEADGSPTKRLENQLEAEYLRILEWAYDSQDPDLDITVELYRRIVGVFVSLREPLALEALSGILGKELADVRSVLRPLSSVFFVDADPSIPIRCYHATFREFLLTIPHRSTDFHRNFLFDGPQNLMMVQVCVERLSQELRMGLCVETTDYDDLHDIPGLDQKLSILLPSYLRYCCLYWNHHLLLTPSNEGDALEAALGIFCGSCLLNWIEAMSLLGRAATAIPILWKTNKWYQSRVCHQLLLSFNILPTNTRIYLNRCCVSPRQS